MLPAFGGVALAFIDAARRRLPDPVTLPSYAAGAGLLGIDAVLTDHGVVRYLHALAGMAALFVLYAAQWLVVSDRIGLGDAKLAGVVGLHLAGWVQPP